MLLNQAISLWRSSTHTPCGDECANVVKMSNDLGHGMVIKTDMVAVYRANDEGKIVSLKAYWEYSKIAEQFAKLAG